MPSVQSRLFAGRIGLGVTTNNNGDDDDDFGNKNQVEFYTVCVFKDIIDVICV